VKLVIVDDSALMRRVLYDLLSADKTIEIVGSASNGEEALDSIPSLKPDIVTMDINMPKMNGLTALKHIMIKYPTPVLMLSAFTIEGSDVTFDSLKFGAVDFITKPSRTNPESLRDHRVSVINKVKNAAGVKIDKIKHIRMSEKPVKKAPASDEAAESLIYIRTSTGGYSSILQTIPWIDSGFNKSLIIQTNISVDYLKPFVKYLNKFSEIRIAEAADKEYIQRGHCYINPVEHQLSFSYEHGKTIMNINRVPAHISTANSTDVSILSYSEIAGDKALLFLLSGEEGVSLDSLREIKRVGGKIYAQDPETCLRSDNIDMADDNSMVSKFLKPKEISRLLGEL
jgi:two-component system chemotaxis response regulator CheB